MMFLLGANISQATNDSQSARESVFLLVVLSKPPTVVGLSSMLRVEKNPNNAAGRVGIAAVIDSYNIVRPQSAA
jgi:hypothetical protein